MFTYIKLKNYKSLIELEVDLTKKENTIDILVKDDISEENLKKIMRKAGKDPETKIFILGNAPTALYQLKEMIENGEIEKPALVIGVPVGFVGAAESKEEFKKLGIPYITINGRKGGSTIGVAILHGIIYQIYKREGFHA